MKRPEEVIKEARIEHHGTVIDWPGHWWGWACMCGVGCKSMEDAFPNWEQAARDLNDHENAAIFLALCDAGYMEVFAAAMQSENKDG